MRHYEIVFLVHPDQSAQVPKMIQQYKSIIESSNGKVHRLENWGLRQLAYPINKLNEACYVLMNIECTPEARTEITDSFHFSDAILRNLILSREKPILEPSPIIEAMKKEKEEAKAKKFKQSKEKQLSADSNKADKGTKVTDADKNNDSKSEHNNTIVGKNNEPDTSTQAKHTDTTEK